MAPGRSVLIYVDAILGSGGRYIYCGILTKVVFGRIINTTPLQRLFKCARILLLEPTLRQGIGCAILFRMQNRENLPAGFGINV